MNSQCSFVLCLTLNAEQFKKMLMRKYELYPDDDNKYADHSLASKGITVTYHDNAYKKKIKLILDWNKIIEDETNNEKNLKYLRKLETRIKDYFDSEYRLNDFKLSEMRIVVDIDVHYRENAVSYMKLFKKIAYVKGFSPSGDNILDSNEFGLIGNSNGIEFKAYYLEDKSNILRTEIRLKTSKSIKIFTNKNISIKQIIDLSKHVNDVFMNIFTHIVPFGVYYKKDKAIEIINKKVKRKDIREKMLRLIELIPEKKSLLLAQKALNCRKIDDVMYKFSSINLSPVTISKRHDTKFLKNLYEYF